MSPGLTERQQRILQAITDLIAQNGYPPTLREVGAAVGLNSPSSVAYQLGVLQGAGYIKWVPRHTRTLKLVPEDPAA